MKAIAPAVVISVLVMCAIGALVSLDGGVSADDIQPAGTNCDTPPFDPCPPPGPPPGPDPGEGIDAMSIDMDPSAEPANTATSIGSREFCARINENDVLDADEDDVDTLEIGVTTGPTGIPESHPLFGFSFDMAYDPSVLTVTANDVELMLAANEDSFVSDASSLLPGSDGRFVSGAIDIGFQTVYESGPGTLSRITIKAIPDASAGIHHLVLSHAVHIDSSADVFVPQSLDHGVVAIDADCPASQPDPVDPPGPSFPTPTSTPPPQPPSTVGGMDAMSIDMDPSSEPANTATLIGSREFCARINENDVLDADEDGVDTLEIDVTTGPAGIPESHPMHSFSFLLAYDANALAIVGTDTGLLLDALAGSAVSDRSESLPDVDGLFLGGASDSMVVETAEFGAGVLARLSVEPADDAPSGVHHLVLTGGVHSVPELSHYYAKTLVHGVATVDAPCPATQPAPPSTLTTGGMDAMSIDMDPSFGPANTATSIGSREFCARINENDVLDADEDTVDSLGIDVTTGPEGIPASNPMLAFNFELLYDSGSVVISGIDVENLLGANEGSEVLDASQSSPDADGAFIGAALDFSVGPDTAESGPGVLASVSIETTSGPAVGIHHLILHPSEAAHIGLLGEGILAGALDHAVVAIGTECPATQPEPSFPATPTASPSPTLGPTITPPPNDGPTTTLTAPVSPDTSPTPTVTPTPTPSATPAEASESPTITPAGPPNAGGVPDANKSGGGLLLALAAVAIGVAAAGAWAGLRVWAK